MRTNIRGERGGGPKERKEGGSIAKKNTQEMEIRILLKAAKKQKQRYLMGSRMTVAGKGPNLSQGKRCGREDLCRGGTK